MRTYNYAGTPFLAHNIQCANGFKTDRRYGLIYMSYRIFDPDGSSEIMGVEAASIAAEFCALCGTGEATE